MSGPSNSKFTFRDHKDSVGQDVRLIKEWKDIISKVGDHQMVLQSVKDSPYYEAFSGRANEWETKLADLDHDLMKFEPNSEEVRCILLHISDFPVVINH